MPNDTRQNKLARNVVYNCGAFTDRGELVLVDNRVIDTDPGFVNATNGNYSFREDAPVYKHNPSFKSIPLE